MAVSSLENEHKLFTDCERQYHLFSDLVKSGKHVPGEEDVVVAQKPLLREYDFFFGWYVRNVCFHRNLPEALKVFIFARCWASKKKYTKHEQRVVLELQKV